MKPDWWAKIRSGQFDAASNLEHSRLTRDSSDPSWFCLHLEPVYIDVKASPKAVDFKYQDIDNGWWKSGMDWDFIQVKRVK